MHSFTKRKQFLAYLIFFFCCAWACCLYLVKKYACLFFLRILFECDFTERLIKLLQLIQRVRSFFLEFVSLLYRYYINSAHRTHLLCKKNCWLVNKDVLCNFWYINVFFKSNEICYLIALLYEALIVLML